MVNRADTWRVKHTTMHTLTLLTRHAKQAAVQAPLERAGFQVVTINDFDTDTLGSFTGETARAGSQLDAATTKAKMAAERSGSRYGLGSEGSFGPDPYVGLTPWGCELLVWWDAVDARSVFAVAQGPQTNYAQTTISRWEDARAFAVEAGFESHGVIIGKPGVAGFSKECDSWPAFERQFYEALRFGPVWLETDMRAHRNPTRMAMIGQCAAELSRKLQCLCPACNQQGFGMETPLVGAVCQTCGTPTLAVRAKRVQCGVCNYIEEVVLQATVPAARCEVCNP